LFDKTLASDVVSKCQYSVYDSLAKDHFNYLDTVSF